MSEIWAFPGTPQAHAPKKLKISSFQGLGYVKYNVLVLPGLQKRQFRAPKTIVNYVVWAPKITFSLGLAAFWRQETRPNR